MLTKRPLSFVMAGGCVIVAVFFAAQAINSRPFKAGMVIAGGLAITVCGLMTLSNRFGLKDAFKEYALHLTERQRRLLGGMSRGMAWGRRLIPVQTRLIAIGMILVGLVWLVGGIFDAA